MKHTTEIDDIDTEYEHDRMVFDSMLHRGATEKEAAEAVENLFWYGSFHSPDDNVREDLTLTGIIDRIVNNSNSDHSIA